MGRYLDEDAPRTSQSLIIWRADQGTKSHAYVFPPGLARPRAATSLCGRARGIVGAPHRRGARDDDYCKSCLLVVFDAIPEGEFDLRVIEGEGT